MGCAIDDERLARLVLGLERAVPHGEEPRVDRSRRPRRTERDVEVERLGLPLAARQVHLDGDDELRLQDIDLHTRDARQHR